MFGVWCVCVCVPAAWRLVYLPSDQEDMDIDRFIHLYVHGMPKLYVSVDFVTSEFPI
jgi:hypothetical protein